MQTRDEVDSPATGHATPPPAQVGEIVLPCAPTPASILRSIAAAGQEPWFPSRYAAETGLDRDSLDEPLGALRLAGLVRVETWVRGVGQGYVLTPEGRDAAATGLGIPKSTGETAELPAFVPPLAEPDQPAVASAEQRAGAKLGLDQRPPFVVPLLLIVNVLCFFVGLAGAIRGGYSVTTYLGRGYPYILHRLGAVTGEDLLQGQWWRLFTSCFVHVGALHLVMNLLTLAIMGLLAELLWGRWRLAIIYLVSGLAGSCLAMANQPGVMLAGASGAIWGLLASQVAWLLLFRRKLPPAVAAEWVRTLGILFVLNAGVSFLPGISWEAHLGGGVAGFIAACLLHAIRSRAGWQRWLAVVLLAAVPAASIGGLAVMVKWSGRWEVQRERFRAKQERDARNAERARHDAALAEFLRDAGPNLDKLHPKLVVPVEDKAAHEELEKVRMWRVLEKQKPEFAEAVARLTEFKAAADALIAQSSSPATGIEDFDRYRARVREFAEARSQSLAMLLAQVHAELPDKDAWEKWKAAWTKWNAARMHAAALWKPLGRE